MCDKLPAIVAKVVRWVMPLVAVAAPVGGIRAQTRPISPRPSRVFLTPPTLLRSIGEDDAVTLYRPSGLIAMPGSRLAIFDWSEMQVQVFSANTGTSLWTFGRSGGGPQEFRGGHDLQLDRNGNLLVLDNVNGRITRIAANGRFLGGHRVTPSTRQLLPSIGAATTVIPYDTLHLWATVDTAGIMKSNARLPAGIGFATALAGESFSATLDGGAAAVGFRWSDAVVLLDSLGRVTRIIHGPERIEFPGTRTYSLDPKKIKLDDPSIKIRSVSGSRIDPTAIPATQDLSGTATELFVLFNGRDALAGRLIDRYDLRSGQYLGTHVLPSKAVGIAVLGNNQFATLESEFVPVIRIWRVPAARSGT